MPTRAAFVSFTSLITFASSVPLMLTLLGITTPVWLLAYQMVFPVFVVLSLAPMAGAAALGHRSLTVATCINVVIHGALFLPAVSSTRDAPSWVRTAPKVTVAYANVLYENPSMDAAVSFLMTLDVDVLVVGEVTPQFAQLAAAAGLNDRYPHQLVTVGEKSTGGGIWSRIPLTDQVRGSLPGHASPTASLVVGTTTLRVMAVHTKAPSGSFYFDDWRGAFSQLRRVPPASTVLIGDFNATRFHPPLRRLLSSGWDDAHETVGQGLSRSWPQNRGSLIGPLGRLDHALYGSGVFPVAVRDIDIPGSDHSGFVVTFALQGTST
jgi:endonuclease/exonuclease/phosphatase (EEP) superfamily protein YafD